MTNAGFSPLLKIIWLFCPEFSFKAFAFWLRTGNMQVSIDGQALLFFAQ